MMLIPFGSSVGSELRIVNFFDDAFSSSRWKRSVVLLIDELSGIFLASDAIRDDFLRTLRGIQHSTKEHCRCGNV